MDEFFAIEAREGGTIQFITALLPGEREKIEAQGHRIVRCTMSRRVWPWVLGEDGDY